MKQKNAYTRGVGLGHPPEQGKGAKDVDECDEHAEYAAQKWPEINAIVEAIVNRVAKIDRYVDRAAVDTLDMLGLAQGEIKVLLHLNRRPQAPSELARHLLVSTGTMTNRLDKLEQAGLVVRRPDLKDRRGVIVELSADGRATLDRYIEVQAKRERELFSAMSEDERSELGRLLRKALASVEDRAGFSIR
jgi:DNA-binding MarR family transcriptional regulator